MSENVDYFCVEHDNRIVALSSAEKDPENLYAEMTDFATLPDWRGHGLALHLLRKMERYIKEQGYNTAFTIARSASAGMNITFARAGYDYGGRLKNNTNIAGHIESMNIWHKALN
jgi:putative beta-lysine N-acetyltransferase